MRDLENIAQEAEDWISTGFRRTGKFPKRVQVTMSGETLLARAMSNFDKIRQPNQIVSGQIVDPVSRRHSKMGAFAVQQSDSRAVARDDQEPTCIYWWHKSDQSFDIAIQSPLIGDSAMHDVLEVSGVIRDRVFDQLQMSMNALRNGNTVFTADIAPE